MRSRAQALGWLPQLVVCAAAALFGYCVAASPQLYDAGELASAAVELGASHPPGQALHALLAHALTWLPLGPLPARISLFSAACALGAAWFAGRLCGELCAELEIAEGPWRRVSEAAAMLGVLLALPVLRQTLRIEVYTLALLLFLASALALVRWARSGGAGQLMWAALLAGLAACVHPPHALAAALTGACFGALAPRRLLRSPRVVLLAIGSGLFGLLALAYLPIRAHAGASMWGDPESLRGFLSYVSGQAFMANVVHHDRLQLLGQYASYLLQLNSGVPYLGALLLLSPRLSRGKPAVLGLVIAAGAALLAACLQPLEVRNPDNVAYMAPALALAVIAGAAGFAAIAQKTLPVVAAIALGLIALPPASVADLGPALRADVPALETLEGMLVEAPPPRALVLVTSDFTAATWMMAQSVDRVRPDVAVFVSGLSTSSWHWAQLGKHPGLDPRPRRAPGGTARDGYTRGAVAGALTRVPVAVEREQRWLPPNDVLGAYALLDPRQAAGRPRRIERSLGERWMAALARDARRGPEGDSGAAAAVLRDVFATRSRRLFALGLGREALASQALGLWELPAEERVLLQEVPVQAEGLERLPYVIDDRASFLVSLEDGVRLAAAELWALGARERALQLLERQVKREDPLALLQLAHLQAFAGDREAALRTLAGLDAVGVRPEVRAEVEALRGQLASRPSASPL